MRITKVSTERLFNLGNYESIRVGAEADLSDNDNPKEVWSILVSNAEMWFIDQQRQKDKEKPAPAEPVKEQHFPNDVPNYKISPPQPTQPSRNIADAFPEDIRKKLYFKNEGSFWDIAPLEFLGSDNFAKVSSIIRGLKGEYISAGKNSHFRVPIT